MIIFTHHALLKPKQRNITKSLVNKTLKSSDYVFSSYHERKIAYKKFNEIYLKLIFQRENKDPIIITQY